MNKIIISAILVLASAAQFHTVTTATAMAFAPGDVDLSFDAGTISRQFAPTSINALVVQPDGKILVGGAFDHINGFERQGLARLNADGSLDTTFTPPLVTPGVMALAVQPDGKILVGGGFGIAPVGVYRSIVRLNSDGSLDASFNLPPSPVQNQDVVLAILLEPNGRIIIGGGIFFIGNVQVNGLARLNSDGSLATALGGGFTNSLVVRSIALLTDGRIIIGGEFNIPAGPVIRNLARLNPDGTLDATFVNAGTNPSSIVNAVAVQPDGKILAAGSFTQIGGVFRGLIARVNTDGSVDPTFVPSIAAGQTILAMVLQTDGKILIGGVFGSPLIPGSRRGISRLNADGSHDSFYPVGPPGGTDNAVTAISRQADGKVLIGGDFSTVGGIVRPRLARLLDAAPPNSPPNAIDDTASTFEDAAVTIHVLANDDDPDGDALTITGITQGANGSVVNNGDGPLTYTPNANFNGVDTFTYDVSDGNGGTDSAAVTVTVNAVNDAPMAVADNYVTHLDNALSVSSPGVLGNDADIDGPALAAVLVSGPVNGVLSLNGNGSFNYTPNSGFIGTDSFTYVASDGAATSGPATVTILVIPIGGGPFEIIRAIIAGGGRSSSGGTYVLTGTIGQHNAAASQAGPYRVEGGFWPR